MKTFILTAAVGLAALFGMTTTATASEGEKILPSAPGNVQIDTQATTEVRRWYYRNYYRPYYRNYYRPYYRNYYGYPYYNNYYRGGGVWIGGPRGGIRIGW